MADADSADGWTGHLFTTQVISGLSSFPVNDAVVSL